MFFLQFDELGITGVEG